MGDWYESRLTDSIPASVARRCDVRGVVDDERVAGAEVHLGEVGSVFLFFLIDPSSEE